MSKKISILFLSSMCADQVFKQIFTISSIKPRVAAQNYNHLLVKGLVSCDTDIYVNVLSSIPLNKKMCNRKYIVFNKVYSDRIVYTHIPYLSYPLVNQFIQFFYSLISSINWYLSNLNSNKVIICDSLKFSISFSSLIVSFITRTPIVAIVTDIPELMLSKDKIGIKRKVYNVLSKIIITRFNAYVLLTIQMNKLINKKNKPFVVIEGLVDKSLVSNIKYLNKNEPNKTIMYTGGLYKEYGIDTLLNAFHQIKGDNYKLVFYGNGDMIQDILNFSKIDRRIIYKGNADHNIVKNEQSLATILINPRKTNLSLSEYSFPSKNIEYMASGTPVLTTKLAGIPLEYFNYAYVIHDETTEGLRNKLKEILEKSTSELNEFGINARNFVINKKNNVSQAGILYTLLKSQIK